MRKRAARRLDLFKIFGAPRMIEEELGQAKPYKRNSVAKNTLINLAGQVLPLLVGLFTIPVIIKGLGVERFGILSLSWMVIGYFSLFDIGLGRALTQIIAKRLEKEDVIKLSGLVWTAMVIMGVMGILGMVIAGFLSPFLVSKIFKMSDQLRPESLIAFYILSASIPIVVFSSGFAGILTAYHRFDLINAVRLPLGLVTFIGPLLVLPFSNSIVPVVLVLALSRLAFCAIQYLLCLRVMPALGNAKRFIPEAVKPLLSFGGWMTVSNIISPLMIYLDRFIIGALISVTAVAYYTAPYEMVTKLWIVPGALAVTLFPAFAATSDGDTARTIHLLSKGIAATFILLFPIMLIIVTFSREGLMIWLGRNFATNGAPVLKWLAVGVFVNCLAQIVFALVQGHARPDLTAKFHFLEFLIYLPLLLWAIKQYGIVGAAAAWVFRATIDGILLLWATQRLVPLARKLVLKASGYMIMSTIALALCGYPDSLMVRSAFFGITGLVFVLFSLMYLRRNKVFGIMSLKMTNE